MSEASSIAADWPVKIDVKETPQAEKLTARDQIVRYLTCVHNPEEFFKYVRIKDSTHQRTVRFQMWPHNVLLIRLKTQSKQKRLIILKRKQCGYSWTLAGINAFKCHRPVTNILNFSLGENEAAELTAKSRFINDHMPDWLKLNTDKGGPSSPTITFPDTGSRIRSLPSTEKAGTGETATDVNNDEADFHDYFKENMANILATVEAGAYHTIQSTSVRSKPMSEFKEMYRKSLRGENNYYPLFVGAMVRPDQGWEWYESSKKDYPELWQHAANYPLTVDDALGGVEGAGLFDKDAIDRLIIGAREAPIVRGFQHLYYRPQGVFRYYAGADLAEGRGGDFSVLWIEGADINGRRHLAAVMRSNGLEPELFAMQSLGLLRDYGSPNLVCGADAWGQMFLKTLDQQFYSNIFCSQPPKLGYIEFSVGKQQNLMSFSMAVRDGLEIQFEPVIREMLGWNVDDKNRYYSTGKYDDCIIAASNADFAYREIMPQFGRLEQRRYYG